MVSGEILLELYWLTFKDSWYKSILNFLRSDCEEAQGLLLYLEEQHFTSTEDVENYFNPKKN